MTRLYSSPRQARSTRASTPRKIPRICYVDYDSSGSPPETSSVKVQQHSAYEKSVDSSELGDRRGSVPVVCGHDVMETPSTPSRIVSFFSKRVKSNLKRTKSVTKLDRRKGAINNDIDGERTPSKASGSSSLRRSLSLGRLTRRSQKYQRSPGARTRDDIARQDELRGALINHRIRASRSHESLLQITTPTSMHSIDLSAQDIEIKPLHSSILGQEHCFQVSTSNGSKFYSCRSAEERQKWIEHLRKTVEPTQEQSRRTENSLKLWILEAKNLPLKKSRYFCELCLDGTLYARTSSKTKGDMLFWGEQFDFNNLPPVRTITVNLYREADRKKKKEKNLLLAYININVADVSKRHQVEHWYNLSSATVGKAGKESKCDQPLLRVKARYQTVHILPMDLYQDLIDFVEIDYSLLVDILEPQVSVKAKEELATSLVHILQRRGRAKEFLTDIVMAEVDKLDNDNLTFRGNSIATKAMEAYLKLVGDKYLQDTLGDFIKTTLESGDDCEVDPVKVPNNATLQRQQKNLTMYCEMAWFKIVNSHCFFPSELRAVFSSFREMCDEKKRGDLADNLISSCIFLRFLCPSILSPSLFNLTQEFPNEKGARNLTLVAKTIQCLANFTKFGGKEEFMTFMNEFVENELQNAQMFIQQISRADPRDLPIEFDGYIDLGKELSLLHSLLVESLEKLNDGARLKLTKLNDILDDITAAELNPQIIRRHPLNSSKGIYDNVNLTQPDTNANTGVVLDVYPQYQDAHLSKTDDVSLDGDKCYTESLYSSRGRLRSGVTEMSRVYQSTEDYIQYTQLDETPVMTQLSMSPSTYSSKRPEEKQVNKCWSKILQAAEMVNGGQVDLIKFVDDGEDMQNSSLDSADQVSVSQLSTVASSGYQSVGYSQSNSPVESLQDNHSVHGIHGNQQPLSFSNPLFGHGKGEHDGMFKTPAGVAQDRIFHSPSSSSLSSDDGTSRSIPPTYNTHPICKQNTVSSHSLGHMMAPGQKLQLRSLDRKYHRSDGSSIGDVGPSPDARRNLRLHRQCATHRQQNSPQLSQSQSRVNAPQSPTLTPGQLSRSVDFSSAQSPHGMRHAMTEATIAHGTSAQFESIYTPPESPHFGTLPPTWRTSTQTSARMGTSSGSQKAVRKTQEEYEEELSQLRKQLAETQTMLAETQQRLCTEEKQRQKLVCEMQQVLECREVSLQEQMTDKQGQIQDIMSRLHSVEETRHHDGGKLKEIVEEKQRQIAVQNDTIHSLDVANNKLLSALSQLKERCHVQNHNGLASPLRPRLALDDDEMKQSSC
ncbi:hypothetical protein LSH36_471g02009 [Paralvinella palmiformis]|uniref:Ras GTPase-activating protein nGAP-like n=1 Tax=Paralvinella palmiformis TaxID=53620 RepID=A0AAD9MYM0_9ANNE|nr:hypothetical protein LSH36_471g02009 [Paralvinella palmiformis]